MTMFFLANPNQLRIGAVALLLTLPIPVFAKRESRVDVAALLKDTSQSTVRIEGVQRHGRYTVRSHGAGVVVSGDGYIVTAQHVVEGFGKILVKTRDGQTLAARAVRSNAKLDLALLKCNPKYELTSAYFRPPCQSEAGDDIVAIGNPSGRGQVAKAGVLGDTRTVQWCNTEAPLRAVAAPIRPGYSGGGSYDMETGELVGIQVAQSLTRPDIGYIVPEEVVRQWVAESRALDPHDVDLCDLCRTKLGCWLRPVGVQHADYRGGLMATKVEANGPAAQAGWREGDLVVALGQFKVTLLDDVDYVLDSCRKARKLHFRVLRQAALRKGELTLPAGPAAPLALASNLAPDAPRASSTSIVRMWRQAAVLGALLVDGLGIGWRQFQMAATERTKAKPVDLARVLARRRDTQPDVIDSSDGPFRDGLPSAAQIAAARDAGRQRQVVARPVAAN